LVAEYVSADSGNSSAEVFFISDEASLAFTEAGVFDPDTMTITIQ
jgi:hypothetical protein